MENEAMQALIDAARKGNAPVVLFKNDSVAQVWVPMGEGGQGVIKAVDTEPGAIKPIRKRGSVTVFDAASFNQILKDNADAGDIAIYFDRNPQKPSVVAIMNGNGANGPGWSDFRCTIQFRQTPQWVKWLAINGKMMAQAEFAEFIEENIEDVAEPSGAALLEIVTYLQITRSVAFKSALQLSSGVVQFQNVQSDDTKVSAQTVDVPTDFTLGIAPIFGLPSYRVPVRFRYRLTDGKLTLGLKLQRVETMMTQIVEDVISKIERGANVSVMDGMPPEPTK